MNPPPPYTEKPPGPTPTAPPPPAGFQDAMIRGGDRRPYRQPGVTEPAAVQVYETGGKPPPPGVAVADELRERLDRLAWEGARPVTVTVTHGGHTMPPVVVAGRDEALGCIVAPPDCNCAAWSARIRQGASVVLVVARRV